MATDKITWEALKERGSEHYRGDAIQPIDLLKQGQMLRHFALASIIKYAYRNRAQVCIEVNIADMEKIKHYADMLIAITEE